LREYAGYRAKEMVCWIPIFDLPASFFTADEKRLAPAVPRLRVRKYFPSETFAANLNTFTNIADRTGGFSR
jgi:hypothetical protein